MELLLKDARLIGTLLASLLGGLGSFAFPYFVWFRKELTIAILLALVMAISILIGGLIGHSLFLRFKP